MGNIRYLTAGESHGKGLTTIIEGVPSNLAITAEFINKELFRRQAGYGRGGRMKIEKDTAEIISGVRFGRTLGSPIALFIENKDWENWKEVMTPSPPAPLPMGEGGQRPGEGRLAPVTRPRPGHADLSGAIKYNQRDIRNVLERSSARETAARVAVGAVAKRFLDEFGVRVYSWVTEIGGVKSSEFGVQGSEFSSVYYSSLIPHPSSLPEVFERAESSDVRCPDKDATEAMKKMIDEARDRGDSLGGIFEIVVSGVPVGLGSHVQWDRKLNANLAMALMSIQAIKGAEIGLGFEAARRPGSQVHDEIFYGSQQSAVSSQEKEEKEGDCPEKGFYRKSNHAGGIEGGMSNGEDIVLRAAMKPIPTLYKPLKSVDIETKEAFEASIERSDICAVPAASVVGEAVVAIEIANAMIDKFGGDSLEEMKRNYESYMEYVKGF
jgi:chorismate synthase